MQPNPSYVPVGDEDIYHKLSIEQGHNRVTIVPVIVHFFILLNTLTAKPGDSISWF